MDGNDCVMTAVGSLSATYDKTRTLCCCAANDAGRLTTKDMFPVVDASARETVLPDSSTEPAANVDEPLVVALRSTNASAARRPKVSGTRAGLSRKGSTA